MAVPSNDQIHAALDQMRKTADDWETAAEHLDKALQLTADVKLNRVEAGVFQAAYHKYEPSPGYTGDRAREGAAVCREIASTLRNIAKVYEEEDKRGEHALRQLY
ncbi:MAG TPA: type VII secretion target [Nocardia sp.]|uniref:type VII secretion target n=1 Tax=Nocardia TaxID=1817 RepID=UPI002453CB8C|nr:MULTISPECIES: type VII secretion target [Nocardia]HLS75971.1 type VII secretion target [Nocardia sp.]